MKYIKHIILGISGMLAVSSCQQEYLNPSAASEEQVVSSADGLIAMVNGLQQQFTHGRAGTIYTAVTADGLTTFQLKVLNAGNLDETLMEAGGNSVLNNNEILEGLWQSANLTKSNADIIIKNVDNIKDPGTKSGVLAAAHLYRALALGTLATYWQSAPIEVAQNASFSPRNEVLTEAINSLNTVLSTIDSNVPSATFTAKYIGGIDFKNTANALIARYQLILGKNAEAIAAAKKVDLAAKSVYQFDNNNPNPIFFNTFGNRNVTEPFLGFALSENLGSLENDGRVAFYYSEGGSTNLGNAGFYTANTAPIPVYLPGEILLIKAEAHARMGEIQMAIDELDKVLTKTSDIYGVNAAGSKYAGASTADAVLEEIYKQRCVELFLSGTRLEDSRRFGRPASERNRDWYPYPRTERTNNTNTPADPEN